MMLGPDAGQQIADIIEAENLDPKRVVIAHNDGNFAECDMKKLIRDPTSRQLDLSHAKALLKRGYNISLDCFRPLLGCGDIGNLRHTGLAAVGRSGGAVRGRICRPDRLGDRHFRKNTAETLWR